MLLIKFTIQLFLAFVVATLVYYSPEIAKWERVQLKKIKRATWACKQVYKAKKAVKK